FNPFDFPPDKENWTEEDLRELWDDGNHTITGAGWDPEGADEEEWEYVLDMVDRGKEVPIAPFYLPYRKIIPPIPDNHSAIKSPTDLIEELDRIEEFLKWVSYIFEDGSSYVKKIPLFIF
ncbi:MORN domain protein, partial [Trifolium medium]|nr:MORN domain protein [Trifolium medium]